MRICETKLPGVLIFELEVFGDTRGFFAELWNQTRYVEASLPAIFVQDNLSFSTRGVLRGLHYQNPNSQGKLVSVVEGEIFDVALDIRHGSPTFGQWVSAVLTGANKRQIYIPEGFAHGFCVTGEKALVAYKCTNEYDAQAEGGINWKDPRLGIDWPVDTPSLSVKDINWPNLADIPRKSLPKYGR